MDQQTELTGADIERGYADPRWQGWGYLLERQRADEGGWFAARGGLPAAIERADTVVLGVANQRHWNYDQLFAWLNSRPGRHYADMAFEQPTVEKITEMATEAGFFYEYREGEHPGLMGTSPPQARGL
jgi:hypothetical protein